MPVTNVDRTIAGLEAIGPHTVGALSAAERQRLADACKRVAAIVDKPAPPKAGVLADLQRGGELTR